LNNRFLIADAEAICWVGLDIIVMATSEAKGWESASLLSPMRDTSTEAPKLGEPLANLHG
jgi:hypothetical protein